jgi:hypothetical protein
VQFLHVSVTSNHHQADISVHGHDMFSAFSMGSHIVYICCVEFQTFRLINCSMFNISTNVFSEIIYEPASVGLSVKILKFYKLQHSACNRLGRLKHLSIRHTKNRTIIPRMTLITNKTPAPYRQKTA